MKKTRQKMTQNSGIQTALKPIKLFRFDVQGSKLATYAQKVAKVCVLTELLFWYAQGEDKGLIAGYDGRPIPLVDYRLNRTGPVPLEQVEVLIFDLSVGFVAMIVDQAYGIFEVDASSVLEPSFAEGRSTGFIEGVVRIGDDDVIVVDLQKYFSAIVFSRRQ